MELNMSLKQSQSLSPQMMQSMEILQMGSQELLEYIQGPSRRTRCWRWRRRHADEFGTCCRGSWSGWSPPTRRTATTTSRTPRRTDDPISNYGTVEEGEENLYLYVLSQLQMLEVEPETMDAAEFLVESLNQNGWLDETLDALAAARLGRRGWGRRWRWSSPWSPPEWRPESVRVPAPAVLRRMGGKAGHAHRGQPAGRPGQNRFGLIAQGAWAHRRRRCGRPAPSSKP